MFETNVSGKVKSVEEKEGRYGEFTNVALAVDKEEEGELKQYTVKGTALDDEEDFNIGDEAKVVIGKAGKFESKVKIKKA